MSSFSLVISPPDPSRASFTENSASPIPRSGLELLNELVWVRRHGIMSHYALLPCDKRILSFGSWLEPRYIFAAGQLV